MEYQVIYSNRKTIQLAVERNREVIVRAPHNTSKKRIEEIIKKKRLWLYEKINHKQKYTQTVHKKEFVSGETLLYLGRHYSLSIVDKDIEGVEFYHRFYISRANRHKAVELFKRWYIERASDKIIPKVEYFSRNLGVKYNHIFISGLKYRWGSCTAKNNLNFNWRIIKAPAFVIDYIIVHELAHLIESNHGEEFWNIIAVQVPRYKRAKEWLKQNGQILEEDF
jgi:predicted metal-dependent hydrolase